MDAFFASVEQRDDPSLRGRPVAVGGSRERGVVAAASYEARAFGVRSAMASVTARRRCPELLFVKPRFEVYRAVSLQIRAIFADYTATIQPLSLDEAYLDVTEPLVRGGSATAIAVEIRARIAAETGLTASAGVSYNKMLAKLASDHRKPDGLFVITPRMGPDFVTTLPIARFHGIGPVTARRMTALGIHTGLDLRACEPAFLTAHFGRAGEAYHAMARAVDHRAVDDSQPRRSIGAENTFERDLHEWDDAAPALLPLIDKVCEVGRRTGLAPRTVGVKLKYADFRQITRARSLPEPITRPDAIRHLALGLLQPHFPCARGVRLLGVSLSNLEPVGGRAQASLEL